MQCLIEARATMSEYRCSSNLRASYRIPWKLIALTFKFLKIARTDECQTAHDLQPFLPSSCSFEIHQTNLIRWKKEMLTPQHPGTKSETIIYEDKTFHYSLLHSGILCHQWILRISSILPFASSKHVVIQILSNVTIVHSVRPLEKETNKWKYKPSPLDQ